MPDISLGAVSDGSSRLRGYVARPSGDGPWPGVVVIHELFGLDEVARRQCDRLAAAGYVALGPDLFSDGGGVRCVVGTLRSVLTGHGKGYADIEAARQWLLSSEDCSGKVGVIGFCMGGGFALMVANRGFDVASDNYGTAPRHPDEVFRGACPIIASYGKRDPLMLGQAKKLEVALVEAGVEHDIKVYDSAGHSFLNDAPNGPKMLRPFLRVTGIGPEPTAAADAWQRIEAFFATHLG